MLNSVYRIESSRELSGIIYDGPILAHRYMDFSEVESRAAEYNEIARCTRSDLHSFIASKKSSFSPLYARVQANQITATRRKFKRGANYTIAANCAN